jgi:PTH1 family peptidyl-tRNA hydrolase
MGNDVDDLLIVGLGNPGAEYERSRHNIGFVVVDQLCDHWRAGLMREKWQAQYASINVAGGKVHLIKPLTYMNRSGHAVRQYCRFFRIDSQRLLVIHDDLDMAPARVKLVKGGGAGGHNGIRSIVEQLGVQDFYRLKVGIGRPGCNDVNPDFPVEKYVLSAFSNEQINAIDARFTSLFEGVELFVSGEIPRAMTLLNALK